RDTQWSRRGWHLVAIGLALWTVRELRPGALALFLSGLTLGLAAAWANVSARARTVAVAIVIAAIVTGTAALAAVPGVQPRVLACLEQAAKTHTGHVFTVGHPYKLLDAGFYVNPAAPSSSTLTLTRDEAARFTLRAFWSFIAVPLPWQLQSVREL